MMGRFMVVITTTDNREVALRLAEELVKERLVACVQIFENVTSIYWWKEKMERAEEFVLLLKTKEEVYEKVERRIKELHNYTTPEVIALVIERGSEDYLKWLDSEVKNSLRA